MRGWGCGGAGGGVETGNRWEGSYVISGGGDEGEEGEGATDGPAASALTGKQGGKVLACYLTRVS